MKHYDLFCKAVAITMAFFGFTLLCAFVRYQLTIQDNLLAWGF